MGQVKILVADDEPDMCYFVRELLEAHGYAVLTTSNAAVVEHLCAKEKPDVVLLDVVMPQKRVEPIIEGLRRNGELKGLKIIIMSGLGVMVFVTKLQNWRWIPNNPAVQSRGQVVDDRIYWKAAEAYGVDDYIQKPFSPETLMAVIDHLLEKRPDRKSVV